MSEYPSALAVHEVSKTYSDGKVRALNGVSLTIEQGDFFGLLGPNGAGKTTLISIVTNLLLKDSGTVTVCGSNLDTDTVAAKSNLGIVPQEFNFSIFEKVEDIILDYAGYHGIPRSVSKPRIEPVLKRLGLWEKRKVQARRLSGGMKRRLMIARALVHDPKVLILDEPTAGVDIELRRDMWEYLTELNRQGLTILLTTHYLEEAEALCNRLAIINKGDIIRSGKVHELLSELHQKSFLLDLSTPATKEQLASLAPYQPHAQEDGTLEVTIDDEQSMTDLLSAIHTASLAITDIRTKNNRLEELFLHLVTSATHE